VLLKPEFGDVFRLLPGAILIIEAFPLEEVRRLACSLPDIFSKE
jgi:hypothetical protein